MQFLGVLAGFPLVGIKATLEDGQYHEVDSSEMAFKIAGSMVLKEAVRKADPVLLEPIMAVEVRTPEEYMGDVIGDINSRRGMIQSMEDATVTGIAESATLDTIMITQVGREFEMYSAAERGDELPTGVRADVLERVLDLAAELGNEGREGKPVGALFVVGDAENVIGMSRQLILNPFRGYEENERNLLDPALEETIKELSTIDGAFIIRGDGIVETCGAYLKTATQDEFELPRGLGARHHAAAAIASLTDAIAITVSESTGTVLSLATLLDRPILSEDPRIACHYGPFKDSYVLLPVCESGGISLEWFQNNLAEMLTYQELDKRVADKRRPGDLVFLPYLTGTNSPDFNADAKGVLYGLKLVHDRIDCALAVMEGVAYLLHRNLASLERMGVRAERVITTGGGSKSDIWCQIKADQTGYEFAVPKQTEAASLGCALIGAVASGVYDGYQQGIDASVAWKKTFTPGNTAPYQALNRLYDTLYQQLGPVFALDAARDK